MCQTDTSVICQQVQTKEMVNRYHSHKKWKDSLETWAEPAVLRTYVDNQAILEPVLLYCASKCKQTKE